MTTDEKPLRQRGDWSHELNGEWDPSSGPVVVNYQIRVYGNKSSLQRIRESAQVVSFKTTAPQKSNIKIY